MKIFIGGDGERHEFRAILRDVEALATERGATFARRERLLVDASGRRFLDETSDDAKTSAPSLASLYDVDFFILFRSYPTEFFVSDAEALRRVAPLAPIAVVSGAYCEGENRTGSRFLGTRRFYARGWFNFWRAQFELFLAPSGASGAFAYPAIMTSTDLLPLVESRRESIASGPALIFSDDRAMRELLRGTFERLGCEAEAYCLDETDRELERNIAAPRSIVIDGAESRDAKLIERAERLRRAYPNATLAFLCFAAQEEDYAFFEDESRWGRARVVSTPFETDVANLLTL